MKWMWLYCDRSRISPTTTGKDLSKLVFYFPKQVLQTAASDISHDYKDFNQIEIKVTRHSYMKCQFWADLTNLVVFSMFSQWHWRTPLQSGSQRLSRAQVKIMIMVIFFSLFEFHRLRGRLLNTFCVKLNVPMIERQVEENCDTIGDFSFPQTETARQVGKAYTLQERYQASEKYKVNLFWYQMCSQHFEGHMWPSDK